MPRVGLTIDVIVNEAAQIVDADGQRLTLTEIAKRMGVAQPSLYKHIGGLDELQAKLAVKALRDIGDALRRSATGKARIDALRAMANAYRGYARSHPGCFRYLLHTPEPCTKDYQLAGAAAMSVLYDVLEGYGITGESAVDAARVVHSAFHGFVSIENANRFQLPRSVDFSFERLVNALDQALATW
ncbi:TetR/AcrR family transcriptional regulator [Nocardia sp. SYP-A9097]|uniref:TetR/AcrR family transcriptional regulator n=1 Tax=Nocardia sp. SYP-A9097 TaxID=2663237 RepID=UPI00129A3A61|nr:TetR-like C-terminal domain-containing protein [Nocardia sp. SYP-A9097]MRH92332.1 TetR/AcrR family transcriptional regulator [Nocardia sp. SYP-A9097]